MHVDQAGLRRLFSGVCVCADPDPSSAPCYKYRARHPGTHLLVPGVIPELKLSHGSVCPLNRTGCEAHTHGLLVWKHRWLVVDHAAQHKQRPFGAQHGAAAGAACGGRLDHPGRDTHRLKMEDLPTAASPHSTTLMSPSAFFFFLALVGVDTAAPGSILQITQNDKPLSPAPFCQPASPPAAGDAAALPHLSSVTAARVRSIHLRCYNTAHMTMTRSTRIQQ